MMFEHELINPMAAKAREAIKKNSHQIRLKKGEALFLQEDTASFVYYVVAGTIKVLKTSSEGQETILSIYQRGQFLALGVLFNPPYEYPATGMATESTVIWAIPIGILEEGILSSEVATRQWFSHLSRRLEKVQQMLTDEIFSEARTRFKKLLQAFSSTSGVKNGEWVTITLPLTQQELADLLSIRRETFSRLLTQLKEEACCQLQPKRQLKVKVAWLEAEGM